MSIVFKLTSLEDLENLARALKETAILQAKIQLEEDIKRLSKEKTKLRVDIEALKMEKHGLTPPSELEKADGEKEMEEENVPPTTLRDEGAALIAEITDEPIEEVEENVPEPAPEVIEE